MIAIDRDCLRRRWTPPCYGSHPHTVTTLNFRNVYAWQAFPFAAIAMALNAAFSSVLVSIPAVRRALLALAGAPVV